MTVEGIETIEEAFRASKAEGQHAADLAVGASTPPESESDPAATDQPELNTEAQALLDSELEQPDSPLTPENPGFWAQQVDIDGEVIPLGEMRNGYLRQSDYTKKTQALAEERRQTEDATKLFQSYSEDPSEFARALAVEHGWLDPSRQTPLKKIDIPKPLSEAELSARLDELVEERLASDPRVEQATLVEQQRLIEDEFGRLEQKHGVTLSDQRRNELLAEAVERQVFDLDLLLTAKLAELERKARSSDQVIRSGTARPQARGNIGQSPDVAPPSSFEEAWAQAKAEQVANR